jgi:protein tyrosine phosphatase
MRGTIREQRVDMTDNHTSAWHCYDAFDYIESLSLHLRI